jgi:hypothetical protein
MSVPGDKQLGFDPMLTDWLRKSNAQKETDAAFTKENLLKVGFFGPQSLLGQAWSAVTGLLDGTPNPVEQSMVVNQARIDTAKAGGSPEDIAIGRTSRLLG